MGDRSRVRLGASSAAAAAFESGRVARKDGVSIGEAPAYGGAKALTSSWIKGWEAEDRVIADLLAARPVVTTPLVDVRHAEATVTTQDDPWSLIGGVRLRPTDPLPSEYFKPRPIACPRCRFITTKDGKKAMRVQTQINGTDSGVTYFLPCAVCGLEGQKLPTK